MEELLGSQFRSKSGDAGIESIKSAELVCIYFSASWSPPCRKFTPILRDFFTEVNSLSPKLEIVFVSSDAAGGKTEEDFSRYYEEMPWLSIPFSETQRLQKLRQEFHVQQIPCLIVLDQNAKTITKDGRQDVMREGEKAFADWGGSP